MANVRKTTTLPSMTVERELREILEKDGAENCRTLTQQIRYVLAGYYARRASTTAAA